TASVIDLGEGGDFDLLVARAASALHARTGTEAKTFVDGFTEGTKTGATPVSKGVALPHMHLEGLERPFLVLGRSRASLTIAGGDVFGQQTSTDDVHAVFFLVSPAGDPSQHLRMLAQLASRIDEDRFIEEWLDADNEVQLREIFLRNERYISIEVKPGHPAETLAGCRVRELSLPEECLVVAVRRAGRTLVPRGETVLLSGDRLLVIGEPGPISELYGRFGEPRGA
ncbi:MAG: PTS sugar transporter subunit IIA, partial [Planctomycetota bacterium]